jgi:hypothetical protein
VAERQGFEPWEPAKAQRFSRPPRSTTLASLRSRRVHLAPPATSQRSVLRSGRSHQIPLQFHTKPGCRRHVGGQNDLLDQRGKQVVHSLQQGRVAQHLLEVALRRHKPLRGIRHHGDAMVLHGASVRPQRVTHSIAPCQTREALPEHAGTGQSTRRRSSGPPPARLRLHQLPLKENCHSRRKASKGRKAFSQSTIVIRRRRCQRWATGQSFAFKRPAYGGSIKALDASTKPHEVDQRVDQSKETSGFTFRVNIL